MTGYKLSDGKPLPTSQLADYQKSVHYAALTRDNDLSAPTCNDCHGNHGAAPPGVGAVTNVCGTCHAVFAEKFATSVHAQIFDKRLRRVPQQPRRAEAVGRDAEHRAGRGVCHLPRAARTTTA